MRNTELRDEERDNKKHIYSDYKDPVGLQRYTKECKERTSLHRLLLIRLLLPMRNIKV